MELKELETKKAELIEAVENWNCRGEEGEAMQALINAERERENMKGFYVVVITVENNDLFFCNEEVGLIDPKTHKTIREPMGFFVLNIDKAYKFKISGLQR